MTREALQRLLSRLRGEASELEDDDRGRVAAAALLVECARVDANVHESETRAIAVAVRELFDLDDEVAAALIAVAEKRVDEVWHDWLFTEAVRRSFDADARVDLIRKLCDVAHSNGLLHDHEDAFVQRIARELGVSDERFQECRREAGAARKSAG